MTRMTSSLILADADGWASLADAGEAQEGWFGGTKPDSY